jgi:hypothetical protein
MRQISCHGVGSFVETGEAIRIGAHERTNLTSAIAVHLRDDVDQNQGSRRKSRVHGEQRAHAAQRGADQRRRHCRSKFYTGVSSRRRKSCVTVFAQESAIRSARFDAENPLYSITLTVPEEALNRADPGRVHLTKAQAYAVKGLRLTGKQASGPRCEDLPALRRRHLSPYNVPPTRLQC